ncbi:hypothetical protein BS053_RS15675 [Vibrio parahaemolyticus]|nr:hypothetical protein [Vibrio parahaemolyticus]
MRKYIISTYALNEQEALHALSGLRLVFVSRPPSNRHEKAALNEIEENSLLQRFVIHARYLDTLFILMRLGA